MKPNWRKIILGLVGIGFLGWPLFASSAEAALQVRQVLRGQTSFVVGEDTRVIDLGTTVNTSKSIVIISQSAGTAVSADTNCAPGEAYFGSQFDDSSHIVITRGLAHENGSTATVEWQVIEFADGVTVTAGSTSLNEFAKVVTLSTNLTESKALVIITGKTVSKYFSLGNAAGRSYTYRNDETWEVTGYITDYGNETTPASVTFTRNDKLLDNATAISVTIYYQIVRFDSDVNVQHDTVTIQDTTSSNYSTLATAVDETKSILFFSTRAPASTTGAGVEQDYRVRGEITNSGTRATFTRAGTAGAVDIVWYVLTFLDDTTIKKSTLSGTTAALTSSPAWSPAIDTARAFSVISCSGASGAGTTGLDDTNYRHVISTTAITATREGGSAISSSVPYFVAVMPAIKLVTPNNGENWFVGNPVNITWKHAKALESGGTGEGGRHKVKIELSTTGAEPYSLLIASSDTVPTLDAADDTYAWTIPPAIDTTNLIGTQLKVKITDMDVTTNYDTSNANFNIKGKISVISPDSGVNSSNPWFVGDTNKPISWKPTGNLTGNVNIEISANGGTNWTLLNNTQAAGNHNTTYTWQWPEIPEDADNKNLIGEDNLIKISLVGDAEVTHTSPAFCIKGKISNVRITDALDNPIDLATTPILIGTGYKIKWDKKGHFGDNNTEGTVRIYYSDNTGTTYSKELTVSPADSGTLATGGSWDWDLVTTNISKTPATFFSKVKVESNDSASVLRVSNVSANFLTREGALTLSAPNGGTYYVGQGMDITWNPSPNLTHGIDIYFSKDNGGNWELIKHVTNAQDKAYSWTIDTLASPLTTQGLIKIVSEDFPTLSAVSSANFTVQGSIEVTAPAGGAIWEIGDTEKYIDWTETGTYDSVKISVSRNNGGSYTDIVTLPKTDPQYKHYKWTVLAPGSATNQALIKVESAKWSSISDTSGGFTIRETIHVDAPNTSGLVYRKGTSPTISWTINGSLPGNMVDIFYKKGTAGSPIQITPVEGVTADAGAGSGSWSWTPSVPDDLYDEVYIIVQDHSRSYIADQNELPFKIKGLISVSNIGGTNSFIKVGEPLTINFAVSGSVGSVASPKTVNVRLSTDGGTSWGATPVATTQITGEGAYSVNWTSQTGDMGANRRIKVAVDGDEDLTNGTAGQSNVFSIEPKITLTYPNQQSPRLSFNMNGQIYIKWSTNPPDTNFGNLTIKYSKDGGAYTGTVTAAPVPSNNKPNGTDIGYQWDLLDPNVCGSNIKLKIYQEGKENTVYTESAYSFDVLGSIVLNGEANGRSGDPYLWEPDIGHEITWIPTGTLPNVDILYSKTGGAPYVNYVVKDTLCDGSYVWNIAYGTGDGQIDFEKNTNIKFKIITVDGLISDESEYPITIKSKLHLTQPQGQDTTLKVYAPGDTKPHIGWTTYPSALAVPNVILTYNTGSGDNAISPGSVTNNDGYDLWEVPDIISNSVKVKVKSAAYSDIADESDEAFKVKGQIKITSPDATIVGDNAWRVHRDVGDPLLYSSKNIQWYNYGSLGGTTDKLTIKYAPNGVNFDIPPGVTLTTNASGAYGPQSFPWNVPNNIGVNNKIKIIDQEDICTPADDAVTLNPFEIKGKILLVEPKGGEVYNMGSEIDIKWKYAGDLSLAGNLDIWYTTYTEAGEPGTWQKINQTGPVAYNLAEDASYVCHYPWNAPPAHTRYKIKIVTVNDDKVYTMTGEGAQPYFAVKGSVVLNSPGKNPVSPETWFVDDALNNVITWTPLGGILGVDIYIDKDSSDPFNPELPIQTNVNANDRSYTWVIADEPTRQTVTSDKCRIRIYVNGDHTSSDVSTNDFYIKPRVTISALQGLPWKVQDTKTISWTKTGNVGTLRIYFSNGTNEELIKTVSADDLSTSWYIDPDTGVQKVTSNGTIRLIRYNGVSEDTNVQSSIGSVTINGRIDVQSPVVRTDFFAQQPGTVTWQTKGTVGLVQIKYNTNYPTFPADNYTLIAGCDNINPLDGTKTFTVPSDVTQHVKFRVVEKLKPEVYGDSADCAIKGSLTLDPTTSELQNLTVGTKHTIRWTPVGSFSRLAVYYIKDGAAKQPINDNIDGTTLTSVDWTPPDGVISNNILFRIEDYFDNTVFSQTPANKQNTVSGSFEIRSPRVDLNNELTVGQTGTYIKWLKQGDMGTLKIDLLKDGVLVPPADAGLSTAQAWPQGDSGFENSFTWTVPDQIAKQKCRIRITPSNHPELTKESDLFTIKGGFVVNSVSSPASGDIWYVGEGSKDIIWQANGHMPKVRIELSLDGTTWLTATPIVAEAVPVEVGVDTYKYTWSFDNALADQRSDTCKIRIIDVDNPTSTLESSPFTIKPRVVVATPATQIAGTKPTISWNPILGNATTTVEIVLDLEGGNGGFDDKTLTPPGGIPKNSSPYACTIDLPATLADAAVIRVRDIAKPNIVYGDTGTFVITGQITVQSPDGNTKWKVGETNKSISWTYSGDITGNVKIKVDYNGDGTYDEDLATVPIGSNGNGSWAWPLINPAVALVSNNAVIKVESVDKPTILDTSDPFKILGEFAFQDLVPVVKIERDDSHYMTIKWTTKGKNISKVKLEYSPTGLAQDYVEINSNITNVYTDGTTKNSWDWDDTNAVPIPENIASNAVKLRISSIVPLQADTNIESSGFTICGNIYVNTPTTGTEWLADGITQNNITWEIAGKVDFVKISYAKDGVTYNIPVVASTNAHNIDATHGSFPWPAPSDLDKDILSKEQAKIKIEDTNALFSTFTQNESLPFTVKGILTFTQATLDALNAGLVAGGTQNITWQRTGNISAVDVYYSNNNAASFPNPIQTNVAFSAGVATKTIPWDIPETVGNQANGNGYAIRVYDRGNTDVYATTPIFTVKGQLTLTAPVVDTTYYLGNAPTITWDVNHGNISQVKIVGSRSGNFSGGDDEFVIVASTQADNVLNFNKDNTPVVAKGSAVWNVTEKTPSILGNTVKIKVMDANTNYNVQSISPAVFTIKGSLTITTPAVDWKVGDTDKNIEWTATGNIANVHIQFWDGTQWVDVTNPATGTPSGAGNKTFSVTNWYNSNKVPDAKSKSCKLKVTDMLNSDVTIESGNFSVYPTLSGVSVVPTPGDEGSNPVIWRAESANQQVKWTDTSAKVAAVDIYYSSTGVGGLPGTALKTGVSSTVNGENVCNTITVPTNLTEQGMIRVRDVDADFKDLVYADVASEFRILGKITLTGYPSPDCTVGDTNRKITWIAKGNMGILNIYANYGAGYLPTPIGTATYDAGEWPWNPIPDQVSPDVHIKITDADKEADTKVESGQFAIKASLELISPKTGVNDTLTVGQQGNYITWKKYGSIGTLKIELTIDDGLSWLSAAESGLNDSWPAGNSGVENSYNWTVPDKIAKQKCRIRITPSLYPALAVTSDLFTIKGSFSSITTPATTWYVGEGAHDIRWKTNANAHMRAVRIELNDGTSWLTATPIIAEYTNILYDSGTGEYYYNWAFDGSLADQRSESCRIRVIDVDNPLQEISTTNFIIKPRITVTTPGTQSATTKPTIYWNAIAGTKTQTVNVLLDTDGGNNNFNITLGTAVAKTAGQTGYVIDNALPATITDNAMIRVVDSEASFVKGDTLGFKITGNITVTSPAGPDGTTKWKLGETNKPISWTYSGDIGSVNIWADYNGDGTYDEKIASAVSVGSSGSGSWTWPLIPDQVSNNAKIKVESASKPTEIYGESYKFKILGELTFSASGLAAPAGQIIKIERDNTHYMLIGWKTKGANIDKVKLEYSPTGLAGDYVNIGSDIPNSFTDGVTENTWEWNNSSVVPIPKTVASNNVRLRISVGKLKNSIEAQAETVNESGTFVICGNVYISTPAGTETWYSDGTTADTISWELAGKVDNVKISYAKDGTNFVVIKSSTPANNVDATHGNWQWTIPTDVTQDWLSNGRVAKLKLEDQNALFSTNVVSTSQPVIVKGILEFTQTTLDALAPGLVAGGSQSISWTRKGKINTVDVNYCRNNAAGPYNTPIQTGVNFDAGVTQKTIPWSVPEYVGTQADTNGYSIQVKDSGNPNSNTTVETPVFTVKGQLEMTAPAGGTYYIGNTPLVTWNVVHGNIQNVKLIGSRSGNFTGALPGDDMFVILASTPADNVQPFDILKSPVGKGSATWDIQEKTPSILGSTVKIKVIDANANYDVKSLASPVFTIKGALAIDTPAVDWKVGDTDKTINWTAYGNIANVHIQFYDGSQWIDVTDPATGTPSGVGAKSFSVANWYNSNKVPDAKSESCKLKITDMLNSDVTIESGPFTVYPTLSGVTVVPAVDDQGKTPIIWRAGLANQKVTWNDTSGKISQVDIYYYSPTKNPFPGTKLKTVDSLANGENSCTTITVPSSLSDDAVIRVQDTTAAFAGKVYAESTEFRILGRINISAIEQDWFVGDTTRQISWTGYGNEMTQVEILIDYGDGNGFQAVKTLAVGASPWTFDDPDGGITGVGDHVSENVRVKIRDNDATRKSDTEYLSNTFHIAGKFDNFVITPATGDTKVVAGKAGSTISWARTGSAITYAKLEFSKENGAAGSWVTLDDGIDPVGLVPANQAYSWTPNGSDIADNLCLVRITDPDNPAATKTSNPFTVTSKIKVDKPDVNSKWQANNPYDIEWTKWGTFTNVKIYYRPNNTIAWADALEIDPAVVKPSNNVDANHGKYHWNIPGDLDLSETAEIRVVDADHAGYCIPGDSALFTTMGSLQVLLPDGTGPYIAGTSIVLKWKRYGTITGVNVYYSTDNGQTFNPIPTLQGVDFVGAETEHQENWKLPEQVGMQILNNGYVIMVEDKTITSTKAYSPIFTVKGQLQITDPDDQSHTFIIGTGGTITWNIVHGNIQNVKIIGSRSGNFTGSLPGDDMFVITNSTDADNVSTFNPSSVPVAQGSYNWSFPEQTPSILSNNAKIKILDANTNYNVETVSSTRFYIKGKFEITRPLSSDLLYIDKPFNVQWKTYGAISTVKVQFKTENDADWVDVQQIANNPGTPAGPVYTTYSWTPDDAVVDVADHAYVRILQVGDPEINVSATSQEFDITGWFEFLAGDKPDTSSVWPILSAHRIKWTNHGVVANVRIEYTPDDINYYPIRSSEANVGYYDWTPPADTNLSPTAKIRISDAALADPNANKDISDPFSLCGIVQLVAPDPAGGQKYNIGASTTVTWKVTGKINKIKVDYSTNGGGNYNNPIASDQPGGAGAETSCTWNFTDTPSPNVVLRVSDQNDPNAKAISSVANPMHIMCVFNVTAPKGNDDIWTVDSIEDFTWNTVQGTCSEVDIYYTYNAGEPGETWQKLNTTPYGNTGLYPWKVLNTISGACKLRVTDSRDAQAKSDSDGFVIIGNLDLLTPDSNVNLDVGGSPYNITWKKTGSINTVKLEYSVDGVTYPPSSQPPYLPNNPIVEGLNLSNPTYCTVDGGNPNISNCSYPWTIPDVLSSKVRVKVTNEANTFVTDDSYELNTIRSVLNITSFDPVNPEILRVGDSKDIVWTRTGSVLSNVKLEYTTDGTNYTTITDSTNLTTYPWTIPPGALGSNVKVRISSADPVNQPALANISPRFIVKGKIDLQAPATGAKLTVDDTYNITWYTRGNLNGLTPAGLTLRLSVDGGGTYLPTAITTSATPGNDDTINTYPWQVPNQIYTDLVVILAELNADSMVTDVTGPFTIRAGVKVLIPNGPSHIFIVGGDHQITWEKHGTLSEVDIWYDTNEGNGEGAEGPYPAAHLITTCSAGAGATGSFLWQNVPNEIGKKLRIKIADHAAGTQTLADESDANFEIRGSLTFDPTTVPAKDNVWLIDSIHQIKWTKTGTINTVKLEYTSDGTNYQLVKDTNGNTVNSIDISGAGPYTFNWKVPAPSTKNARLKLTHFTDPNVYDESPNAPDTFTMRGGFQWVYPEPAPAPGRSWELGTRPMLRWQTFGGVQTIWIKYSPNNRQDWYNVTPTAIQNPTPNEYEWYLDPATVPIANPVILKIYDATDPEAMAEITNLKIRGKLTITKPDGTETWKAGEERDVEWTRVGSFGSVKLDYSKDGINFTAPNGGTIIDSTPSSDLKYKWPIPPEAIAPNVVVRITQVADSEVTDDSVPFPIRANFVISSPDSTSTWYVDEQRPITWVTQGSVSSVDIDYWSESESKWKDIVDNYANNGPGQSTTYTWPNVADNISDNVKIRIIDHNDPSTIVESLPFKIRGSLTITHPNADQQPPDNRWTIGATKKIEWDSHGTITKIKLFYFNGLGWNPIVDPVEGAEITNNGYYWWKVPDMPLPREDAKIRITAVGYDITDTSDDFKVVGGFTFKHPTTGEPFLINSQPYIEWECTSANIPFVKLEYSVDGTNYTQIAASTPNTTDPAVTKTFRWDGLNSSVPADTNATIRISDAGDPNGAVVVSGEFIIRAVFTLLAPNGGATQRLVIGRPNTVSWEVAGVLPTVKLWYTPNNNFLTNKVEIGLVTNTGANPHTWPWTIPDGVFAQNAKLRVGDPNDLDAYDDSNETFEIITGFEVLSPNGGEYLIAKGNWNIQWTCTSSRANVQYVRIDYSTDGGSTYPHSIATDVLNPVNAGEVGTYSWTNIDDNISKQVKIRVADQGDIDAFDASNLNLNIRSDLTLTAPGGTQNQEYVVAQPLDISWTCVGSVDSVKLEYSTDGTSWTTFATPANEADGSTTFAWPGGVVDDIAPQVRVRVVDNDSGHPDSSDECTYPFRIKGALEITAPKKPSPTEEVFVEIGLPYDITWNTTGSVDFVNIYYYKDAVYNPATDIPIIEGYANTGANKGKYTWPNVPDDATATAKIHIMDGSAGNSDVFDDSDPFHIRGYFQVVSPNGDEVWVYGEGRNITWNWGGTIANVRITYSIDGVNGTFKDIQPSAVVPNGSGSGGTHSYLWSVPDDISKTVIVKVADSGDPDVFDVSDKNFEIRGALTMTAANSPKGGDRWVTREDRQITWNTTGTIPTVKLEYLKYDAGYNLLGTVLIDDDAPNTGADLGKYTWSVANDRCEYVKIRVSDPRDPNNVYALSDGYFKIDYYTLSFMIRDLITNSALTMLSVSGSSNKGDVWKTAWMPGTENDPEPIPLGCSQTEPITVELPSGFWRLTWSKTGYGDMQVAFSLTKDLLVDIPPESNPANPWNSEGQGNIHMETTAVHIWRAYSDFSYGPDTDGTGPLKDSISVSSWMERDGMVVSGGIKADIYVYDGETLIRHLEAPGADAVGTNPDAVGFFHMLWSDTGLETGKVYTVISDITNAAGTHFRTPDSFSITEAKKLQDVEDTVNWALDRPITQVEAKIGQMITGTGTTPEQLIEQGGMKGIIESKLDEQTGLIVGPGRTKEDILAAGGMVGMLQSSLTTFESQTTDAIEELRSGAKTATEAGETLKETALKFSWRAMASPDPALSGDNITIQVQGQPNLFPQLDIYSWDNQPIITNIIVPEIRPGFYSYAFNADSRFTPGKAYTFLVSETAVTGGLVSGSGMVESMGITTVAGLAAAAPEAERAAKKALDAIKAVEAVLVSNENINIALTLKNLKESVDELPEVLNKEGPTTQLINAVNEISDRIKTFVGKEGVDLSSLLDEKLGDAATIKDVRNKTDTINAIVDILLQIMESRFGGVDSPIVSTSLQAGSVKFRIIALNPSKTRTQKIQVKKYLPVEVKPNDIMELGDLELEFDAEQSIYYVYKNDVELRPGEAKVYEVEVEDIWMIPTSQLQDLKTQTDALLARFENTQYLAKAKEITDPIYPALSEIATSQADDSVSRERHIGIYRQNLEGVGLIQKKLAEVEKLLEPIKGVKTPDLLEKIGLKVNLPSKTTTWLIILVIIIFLGLLAAIFFFVWQAQIRSSQNLIDEARKQSFPEQKTEEPKK